MSSELEEYRAIRDEAQEAITRIEQETRRWTCTGCGLVMDYAYMHGDFDKDGCSACGHPDAIEQHEGASGAAEAVTDE